MIVGIHVYHWISILAVYLYLAVFFYYVRLCLHVYEWHMFRWANVSKSKVWVSVSVSTCKVMHVYHVCNA